MTGLFSINFRLEFLLWKSVHRLGSPKVGVDSFLVMSSEVLQFQTEFCNKICILCTIPVTNTLTLAHLSQNVHLHHRQ